MLRVRVFLAIFFAAVMPALLAAPAVAARISAGWGHSLWIKDDGSLHSWGGNFYGELGRPNGPDFRVGTANDWAEVAAGEEHSMAIKSDGTLWAFGGNHYGQLGFGNNAFVTAPTQVGTDTDWSRVIADDLLTLALKTDGSLWAWGFNGNGGLGDGTTASRLAPVRIGTGTDWIDIAAGGGASFGLKADGTLWSWGYNSIGQLGRGGAMLQTSPGQVDVLTSVRRIAAGNGQAYALRTDGTLWSWGYGGGGLLGDLTTENRTTPTQVGSDTDWNEVKGGGALGIALKTDGSLWAWGTFAAQLESSLVRVPTLVAQGGGWSSISAGHIHGMVLANDGRLRVWGSSASRLGLPTGPGYDYVDASTLLIEPGKPVPVIELTAGTSSSNIGDPVTFTASRIPGGYPIEGSLSFFNGTQPLAECQDVPINGIAAACTVTTFARGAHTIRAIYNGSASQNPSLSASLLHIVGPFQVSVVKAGDGSGTVVSNPAGIDCGATCTVSLPGRSTPTLTATPQAGSLFEAWVGCPFPSANSCYLGMLTSDRTVTARFRLARTLTVNLATRFGGSVDVNVPGAPFTCTSAQCIATVAHGTVLNLTQATLAGWRFQGWSGHCSGTTACSLAMDGDRQVTATFETSLTTIATGTGRGRITSSIPGIDCTEACSAYYLHGTTVVLTATPEPGSVFAGWSGSGCGGTGTCSVTISGATNVTATFTSQHHLVVTKSGTGSGTVSGTGIACGSDCEEYFPAVTTVTVSATPAPGSVFVRWGGHCAGSLGCSVQVDGSRLVDAEFASATAPRVARPFDFNGDGSSDIAWRDANGQAAIWLVDGTGTTGSALILGPATGWEVSLADGDFNGDGQADLLWRHADGSIAGWLMLGTGALESRLLVGPGSGWSATHTLDADGDGRSDVVLQHSDGRIALLRMSGLDVTSSTSIVLPDGLGPPSPYAWTVTHAGDFNADGQGDLVARHLDGRVAIVNSPGPAPFGPGIIFDGGTTWFVSHVADLNGDGRSDIVWRNAVTGAVSAWLMNNLAVQQSAIVFGGGGGWTVSHVADLDGNGRADLIFRNDDGSVAAWMMDGLAVTSSGVLFGPGTWRIQDVRDFDGDTRADFLWRNTATGEIALWLMNGLTVASSAVVFGGGGGWVPAPSP